MLPRRSFILVLLMAGGVSCAGIDNRADGGGRADAADDASGFSLDVRLSADPRPCEVEGAMRINPRPADVLVLLDRSGSMDMAFGSSSRYRALASQLSDLVTAYQSHVRFGYIEMPGKSGCETQSPGCCASPPPVELALDNAQAVTAAIAQAWPVGGNTPTAAALLAARLYYLSQADPAANRYVLLATDGVPSCTLSGLLSDGTSENSMSCIDALTQVQALSTMGVKVIVLSVGEEAAASKNSCLNALARAGGAALASTDGPTYSASDPDRLQWAVEQIFGVVARPSCTLSMPAVNKASLVGVYVGGQQIPYVGGQQIPYAGVDGWQWDDSTSPPGIQITGAYCKQIQTFQVPSFEARYGCPATCIDLGECNSPTGIQ